MNIRLLLSAAGAAFLVACGGGAGYSGGGSGNAPCGAYSSCTPSISIGNAAGNVTGMVTLTATAAAVGSYTVTSVQFRVDGVAVGAADTTSPYSYAWDSSTVADGVHQVSAVVTDSAAQTATSANVALTVNNTGTFSVAPKAAQIFPTPVTSATGAGTFTFNTTTGAAAGHITLTGVTATGVEIGDAFAGDDSAAIITLAADGTVANQWDIPAGAALDAQQRIDLSDGKLYVLVRSAAHTDGELRDQILPAGIKIEFATLTGSAEVPAVTTSATGEAAVTVNSNAMLAAVHIHVPNLTATGAQLVTGDAGTNGTLLAALTAEGNGGDEFENEDIALLATDITNFNNGSWYVNVFSAAHPTGEVRGQFEGPAPTLAQLQTDVFTPLCSSCHTGTGTTLPGVQNLTAGNTYASIVSVASIEQPAVLRIAPGDPDNSYLVRKIQGTAGITGSKMPLTGTITQAQINEVRAWVAAGAQNN